MNSLAHPLITITNVIWCYDHTTHQVNVLLVRRSGAPFKDYWALPETHMQASEGAHVAALRLVREKLGLALPLIHAEQLATFTAPDRVPGERALSLSYMVFLPTRPALIPGPGANDVAWFALQPPTNGRFGFTHAGLRFTTLHEDEYLTDQTPLSGLAFDHNWILTVACSRIANKLDWQPTVLLILGPTFTLKQARTVYAAFGQNEPDNSNFLRDHQKFLKASGIKPQTGPGRPAKLYVLTVSS